MDYNKLAELLFPHINKTPDDYNKIFPKRELKEGAKVTRLGPSPTGFIHLGNLYGGFADERMAHQSGGVFYLRIEDTDDKREVEGAVEIIINSLKFFGINFDEGATMEGDLGIYGPYHQSQRGEIYQCFAKELVKKGLAYPCFMTSDEIAEIKEKQEAAKVNTGIYGKYAAGRNLSYEEIEANIKAGKSYVIRLKSDGETENPEKIKHIKVMDAIRGELVMPENYLDVVILKATGIPTYHFAHVIDDHFMGTTHVVRGEEWLPSLPIHVELFDKVGFEMPIFCHTAHLMKIDEETGQRRKLSKRKDPELALDYYRKQGYHPQAVREYLLTILNSNYEEWRIANPDSDATEFEFSVEKMGNAGALFDLNKLNDICKDVLVKIPACDLRIFLLNWAKEFKPEVAHYFDENVEFIEKVLDLGRTGDKPRKDLIFAEQILEFISYFFDEYFSVVDQLPANVSEEDNKIILEKYLETYDHSDDQSAWFDKIRGIAEELGYAAKPKDYKKNPDMYKGHVGDVSTAIRLAVVGRTQSPDIWEIQQILGEEKTKERVISRLN